MTQSLEEYVSQATQAYQPAQTAIQSQIDALSGRLATTNEQINKNYAQQQAGLNRARNAAAESASLQAAGSGGSFGGSANLANRRYYDRTFVPAVTQLQTNQANDLASARQANEDERTNLNSQLANLQAQANQQALAQYYSDQQLEKQIAAQRQAAAAQNAYYKYLMDAAKNQNQDNVKKWDFGNGYSVYDDNGQAVYSRNGTRITRGEFLQGTGGNGIDWDTWNDIWNSGTRTEGVGSDTVAALSGIGGSNAYKYKNTDKYGYLWY